MIGRTLGHYRIAAQLGKGGMGEVYLAEDTKLHRRVALKILPAEVSGDPERRKRFEREAQAVAALNHPGIVTVHSVEEAEGVHFITMELVEGRTLSELIPKDGLPLGRFFEVAVPLADAISAAHGRGITHRDLKPENVMVTGDGRVKVLDFGLAKLMEGAPAGEAASTLPPATTTEPGRILGTVAYMSPEQAEGKPVDPRSDIFSLGVLLYVMATGRRPFEGDTPASILSSVLKDTPPSVTECKPALPKDLGRIVRRCLHKDPERRYQTAKDIRNELDELRQAVDSGELQLPIMERPRRRLVTIAAVVGLVVLALGISIYAVFSTGEVANEAWVIRPLTTFQGVEWNPTWSPDGSTFAYEKPGRESIDIYVMATSGGDPRRLTSGPHDNTTPRWSPKGDFIAFLSSREGHDVIFLIPPLSGSPREITRIAEGTSSAVLGAMPWSPDGKELLYTSGDQLWKVDIRTRVQTRLKDVGDVGGGAAWSPDGRWIAFERWQEERPGIWMIPAEGGEAVQLVVDMHGNSQPAWSADGRSLVFLSDRNEAGVHLWEFEVATKHLRQLTFDPDTYECPTVARDGRIAFVQVREGADLYIKEIAEGEARKVTFERGGNYWARFSPDGKRLVYESNRTGDYHIWIHDLESGAERQLTLEGKKSWGAGWSPDGREIVYVSIEEGRPRLRLLKVDDGTSRPLMDQAVSAAAPMWSPDGLAISFLVGKDVWAVDPSAKNPRQLIAGILRLGHMQENPEFDWYLDSRRAVYSRRASDGSGEPVLMVRDLVRGHEVELHRGDHAEPIVAPDGTAVAFCRGRPFHQELCVLRLRLPDSLDGLPEPFGEPQQLTSGRGIWHVHNGGFSPDGTKIVFTQAEPESEILVIENYR